MPAIDLSVLCIPAECDNIKLPIECVIASRWDAYLLCDICRHFASVMLHFASLHYIFSAYLPTHIKFLTEFHRIFFGTTGISLPMKFRFGRLIQPLFKKSCCHQGFFAVKRRAVFILGAMWIALVRGWRSDCVVGGMETRFQ